MMLLERKRQFAVFDLGVRGGGETDLGGFEALIRKCSLGNVGRAVGLQLRLEHLR